MSDNTSCQGTNPVSGKKASDWPPPPPLHDWVIANPIMQSIEGGVSGEYTYTRARFSPILSDSNSSENGSGCSGRCYDSDQNADCFGEY